MVLISTKHKACSSPLIIPRLLSKHLPSSYWWIDCSNTKATLSHFIRAVFHTNGPWCFKKSFPALHPSTDSGAGEMNPEQQQSNVLAACYTYSHHLDLWPQSFHRSFTPKHVAFSLHNCTAINTSLQKLIFSDEHHLLCSVCTVLRDRTAQDR